MSNLLQSGGNEEPEDDDIWDDDEDTLADRYLMVGLAGELYALAIAYVYEIIPIQDLTTVPEVPAHVRGVINLRGHVVPVIDLRLRFGLDERPYDDRTCVIITSVDTITVGIAVDKVDDVRHLAEGDISPRPEALSSSYDRFISGVGQVEEGLAMVLDVALITAPDHRQDTQVELS